MYPIRSYRDAKAYGSLVVCLSTTLKNVSQPIYDADNKLIISSTVGEVGLIRLVNSRRIFNLCYLIMCEANKKKLPLLIEDLSTSLVETDTSYVCVYRSSSSTELKYTINL